MIGRETRLLVLAATVFMTTLGIPAAAHAQPGWTTRNAPDQDRGHVIKCHTATSCQAVTPYALKSTNDDGGSWQTHPVPLRGQEWLDTGSCPAPDTCFVGGFPDCGAEECRGGFSFCDTAGCVPIFKTSDGGATWTRMQAPAVSELATLGGVYDIECPTTSVCYVAIEGHSTSSFGLNRALEIWATTDGGATWRASFLLEPMGVNLGSIDCVSTLECVFAGDKQLTIGDGLVTGGDPTSIYATTTDGGLTWREDTGDDGFWVGEVSCPTLSRCWVAGMQFDSSPAELKTWGRIVHRSSPTGAWVEQYRTPQTGDLWGLDCPTTQSCFGAHTESVCAGGGCNSVRGDVLRTRDGGSTWTTNSLPSTGEIYEVATIHCYAVFECWAGGLSVDARLLWTYRQPGITARPSSPSNSTSASFSFTGESEAGYECSLDGAAFASCTSPVSHSSLGDGSHTFRVRQRSGAAVGEPEGATWTVDTVAPDAPSIDSGPADGTTSTSASLSFTGEPGGTYQCSLDGATFAACTSPKSYSGLAAGSHEFRVRQRDDAGNTGAAASHSWTRTPVAPSLTSKPQDPSNATAPSFAFTGEPGATFACQLDGGGFSACSSPKAYSGLTDGPHTFAVRQTVNGATSADTTHAWTVDTVPPDQPTITSGPSDPSTSRAAAFTFTASGASATQCKLDNGSWGTCASPKSYTGLLGGAHTFSVRALDAAGNASAPAASTWSIVWEQQNAGVAIGLADVSCPSSSTCFVAGVPGTGSGVIRTRDGGATWTRQLFDSTVGSVACPSTNVCYAPGSMRVQATTDGGTTWSSTPTPATSGMNDIACPSTTTCIAVGYSGAIIATSTSGTTWTVQVSGTTQTLESVSCADTGTCFAVGEDGVMLKTANGGATWSSVASGEPIDLESISCPTASFCAATGTTDFSDGYVRFTTNGGTSWYTQPLAGRPHGIACTSTAVCYAVGSGTPNAWSTTNGTMNWVAEPSGTTASLNAIACRSTGTCWAVGYGPSIRKR